MAIYTEFSQIFPLNIVIFHNYVNVYQRVLLFWPQFMALCFYPKAKDDKEDDKDNSDDKNENEHEENDAKQVNVRGGNIETKPFSWRQNKNKTR